MIIVELKMIFYAGGKKLPLSDKMPGAIRERSNRTGCGKEWKFIESFHCKKSETLKKRASFGKIIVQKATVSIMDIERMKVTPLAEKDITEKVLEAYNDVFADIVNVLLFDGNTESRGAG